MSVAMRERETSVADPFATPASAIAWGEKMLGGHSEKEVRAVIARSEATKQSAEGAASEAKQSSPTIENSRCARDGPSGRIASRPSAARNDFHPCGTAPLPLREARWLLEAAAVAAGRDPLFITLPELTPRVIAVFRSYVARRARGEPLAYVIGEASFRGLDLVVTPDVLIPRPETELLVEIALELIPPDRAVRVLDQGTGSGAIAIALAVARPRAEITAIDVSQSALDLAVRNARRHGVADRVSPWQGDLFPAGASERKFDAVVANLPYVADDFVLPADVAEWEPARALRGGQTGLEIIERSRAAADEWVKPGGFHLYELGESIPALKASSEIRHDLAGRPRYLLERMT